MHDTGFEVRPEKRNRLSAIYGRPDVADPAWTASRVVDAWRNGFNEPIDVSASYPVDAPHVFARGGHGLFGTIGDYFRFAQILVL